MHRTMVACVHTNVEEGLCSRAYQPKKRSSNTLRTLSNWGRWGADDQLGTLNLLTPEKTRRAVGLVREGVTISCARTIRYEPALTLPLRPSTTWWRAARAGPVARR